ncbi:hypothetical protein HK414_13060 [Ramlibacter terrae]|uniref:Uncharacterized protein n=1 Tax=Ramlibacter terrae TaxID=2732511 RepID=A0ABX6P2N8_9BURK|nr:hypothetical protein HK414_13060 [Ramlibacter terrae]
MKSLIAVSTALLACVGASAQNYADWTVQKIDGENAFLAATMNSTGGIFGRLCSPEGCLWVMTLQATCTDGNEYPALLSTPNGAVHVDLRCAPNDRVKGRYVFTNYELANKAISGTGTIGIAFPMESGDFRVSRFSLRGMEAATQRMVIQVQTLLRGTGERRL